RRELHDEQQPVADSRLEFRVRRNDPLLASTRQLVRDHPIAVDGEIGVRFGVSGRGGELVIERECPDGAQRKEPRRNLVAWRSGLRRRRQYGGCNEGTCTTTSCGPASAHTAIIASIPLLITRRQAPS